ncbi:Dos2-interacting transcription regulator of RNA-Pol-II-domain-containing protein [Hypomontagnella monticulosa]|nr:Dos2-interacting transcription regulator of RNA-Pol-II-domain-containing protein [Hypomontagnella monticulosa]
MTTVKFEDLALQYVLTDESNEERAISEKAAAAIQESNSRITIAQWVSSINRWIQPDDDSGDENLIARAKALGFLASTLQVLNETDVSLKAEQVKLLVTFFGSLFSSDHRAGVTASAKALRCLVGMKSFQPTLGDDILANVCKLGEDFKLQTPTTRLELYELLLGLFQDPAVANDLQYRHGSTCGFMTGLLELCRNERDPQNLMKWFETLKTFLQNFSPSEDITLEVFKTFSAYFPISLRASSSPSGITADDLKNAVRSCFASHYRVAGHAIPYLVNKLDQGDAVTVPVKVDILQTLDACLVQYDHPKQSVVPFIKQIWDSLKYEVRNGEIPDTIKATLKVIRSLTTRLDEQELQSFIESAWKDLVPDLSSPTYTVSAGKLLVAISGASFQSFSTITSQALPHIKTILRQTQSSSHKQELVALLNSILSIRSQLINTLKDGVSSDLLKDEHFGDSLFVEIYAPLWEEASSSTAISQEVGVLKKVMEGLSAVVGQQSTNTTPPGRLCSDSICEKIFGWLANPSVIYPLEGKQFSQAITNADTNQDIRDAAVAALKEAVPLYPPSFQLLLQQYLWSLKIAYENQLSLFELPLEIKLVAGTLCEIGCSHRPGEQPSLSNAVSLINVLLEALVWLLSLRATPRYWTAFICSIHLSIVQPLGLMSKEMSDSSPSKLGGITKEWYSQLVKSTEITGAFTPDSNSFGHNDSIAKALELLKTEGAGDRDQLLAYSLLVVEQLYRRFTVVYEPTGASTTDRFNVGLSKSLKECQEPVVEQDICLHQLGLLAASVIRALSEDEQKALDLGKCAFLLFHGNDGYQQGNPLMEPIGMSPLDEFRTAPLSMGILQGLYPGVMSPQLHLTALKSLWAVLTSVPSPCSDATRAALDTSFAILSNKFRFEVEDMIQEKIKIQQNSMDILTSLWSGESEVDVLTNVRIFRSILHFLAGDVARFRSTPSTNHTLLDMVCDKAPRVPVLGRQLAKCFDILVSPKECLEKDSHAILKRLSSQWLYSRAVQPYLKDCFPNPDVDEAVAINRSIVTFAILKHLKFEHYAVSGDVGQIVRVGIRSLSTLDIGVEMESCLHVLLQILEKEPSALKEHLAGLITGMAAVYEAAKKEPQTTTSLQDPTSVKSKGRERVLCRKFALEFFEKLPDSYEAQYLVPYRQQLLRPLSAACGDSVREIRRTALAARKAWEGLA